MTVTEHTDKLVIVYLYTIIGELKKAIIDARDYGTMTSIAMEAILDTDPTLFTFQEVVSYRHVINLFYFFHDAAILLLRTLRSHLRMSSSSGTLSAQTVTGKHPQMIYIVNISWAAVFKVRKGTVLL